MDDPYFYIALIALPNEMHGVNTNIVTNLSDLCIIGNNKKCLLKRH